MIRVLSVSETLTPTRPFPTPTTVMMKSSLRARDAIEDHHPMLLLSKLASCLSRRLMLSDTKLMNIQQLPKHNSSSPANVMNAKKKIVVNAMKGKKKIAVNVCVSHKIKNVVMNSRPFRPCVRVLTLLFVRLVNADLVNTIVKFKLYSIIIFLIGFILIIVLIILAYCNRNRNSFNC
jgi:hypothetical protein